MRWRGRWVLVLALVLVVASVAVSAGSQTFVNDTGQTATGIVITFSTQALITWNDGKLPVQTPDGMSYSFTFSGGSIEPGAGFMISWGPDSASVVDYQWLTKEETTATPPADSPTVANNLPGPAEPLYQPQADEQVWLTDAEGHGVIYDNDSIKLNFAPAFDLSQIERIVWYRNGIRMRFVNPEDKVQVLTNALMKTFDGNPLEHSPASAHTDHAIAGYDYKVEIHLKDGGLKILETTVESTFKWHPKEVWAQVQSNYVSTLKDMPFNELVSGFTRLKNDGFTGISVDIVYYMDTPFSNDVKTLPSYDLSIIDAWIYSPSENNLETMLKAITEAGLEAHVRAVIYVSKEYQKEHGFLWSSMITPSSPALFFDNYTNLLLELVPILNKYHVELITPFTEMDGIEKYSNLIKNMYDQIARVFTGELGFEEATHLMLTGFSPMQKGRTFEQMEKNFTFWDWEDANGEPMRIEYSTWDMKMETQKDQRVSVIERMFKQFWSRPINYYNANYPNKPQMWGEIGARDADGYLLGADYYYSIPSNERKSDEQERSDFMYAMLKDSKELGIDRMNIWTFLLADIAPNWKSGNGLNIGLNQPITPAYRVIKAIIGPAPSQGETEPASSSN